MMVKNEFTFGSFRLLPDRRTLLDNDVPVALGARAFDLLVALVQGRDRLLGKDELLRLVWPSSAVEDNNLTVTMSALRRTLRDTQPHACFIRTVSGRGYQFVAPVRAGPVRAGGDGLTMPSIAVLPFLNLGEDPGGEHLGDGLAVDIIAELSRNRWLTVIARNSSFSYKGTGKDPAEIARQVGVRYVLEGTVRTAGHRVRVTAHLIDAADGVTLIAERFDRELADIFVLQDEITARITDAVRPVLYEAEQARSIRRHPDSVDAWAAFQRGVWHFSRFAEPESAEARFWFERAIALDDRFAPGFYGLGLVFLHDGSGYMLGAVPDWQPRGEALALKAVALDGRDSGAHSILAVARMVRGDHAGALQASGDALALNPNDATAHGTEGATLVFDGRPLEGLRSLATCLRLNPRDPRLRVRHAHIGLGHFFAGQHAEAESTARMIMRNWPAFSFGPRLLAMVHAENGRDTEALAAIRAAIALSPAPFDDFRHARMPWYRPDDHARILAAFRRCGWSGSAG